MGIRGAWSLLSNDPRRFGKPWNPCGDDDDEQWIFLDGPSLLYHVAVKDVFDEYPPIVQPPTKSTQQACPRTIHQRVSNFLLALLEAVPSTTNVHVVMDGLAPAAKIPTQVQRMAERCGENSHNILHLQAESAMVEAIEDMMQEDAGDGRRRRRLQLHRPSHGEAETYIHHWLMLIHSRAVPLPPISILSNDTDFLIFSTCPGFVPLSTLAFTKEDSKLRLSGFEYLRSKFTKAHFPGLSFDYMDEVMTCVAALAGCDYVCDEHEDILGEARTSIIQSDISGLRVKQRNKPTRASALVAIVRYIGHYARHSQRQGDWKEPMSLQLFLDSAKSELLLEAFREIHQIYFPRGECPSKELTANQSVEISRLLERCTIFCRPLVEPWTTSESSAPVHSSRKNATLHTSLYKEGTTTENLFIGSLVPVPPLPSQVLEWKSHVSVWLMPHFRQVRLRLYSFIRHQEKLRGTIGCEDRCWCSDCPFVTEFVRLGQKNEFGPKEIHVPPLMSDSLWGTGLSESLFRDGNDSTGICDMAIALVTGSSRTMGILSDDELREHATLFLSSLMLPRPAVLFLSIIGTAPTLFSSDRNPGPIDPSLQEVLCMASVAWFHASLVCEALLFFDSRVKVCNVFDNALAQMIWELMTDTMADSCFAGDSEDLGEAVFDRLPAVLVRECSSALNPKDLAEWKHTSTILWMGWCQCESLFKGGSFKQPT
jgi:hypothetical protein